MSDSYIQVDNPIVYSYYRLLHQVPTRPPSDVTKEDAETAVKLRKPKVVIGGYVTHKYTEGDNVGNAYGPQEEVILQNCDLYIMIGNSRTHGIKPILKLPHEEISLPGLVTRSVHPGQNIIYTWHNKS
jgi:hypothetical protein